MGESNTIVSTYTTYTHLQQYCSHPSNYVGRVNPLPPLTTHLGQVDIESIYRCHFSWQFTPRSSNYQPITVIYLHVAFPHKLSQRYEEQIYERLNTWLGLC